MINIIISVKGIQKSDRLYIRSCTFNKFDSYNTYRTGDTSTERTGSHINHRIEGFFVPEKETHNTFNDSNARLLIRSITKMY